jgi:hypothetical protein
MWWCYHFIRLTLDWSVRRKIMQALGMTQRMGELIKESCG